MAVFEVYAGDMLIHHSQSPSPDVKLITPKLTLQVNSAGSFTCKIPPSNIGFDTVERLTTVITVKKDGVSLWGGRIISEEADFWGNRAIICEGELAYLNDTSQPPHEYHGMTVRGFLQALINIHNAKVDSSKQFSVGVITVTDPNDSLYRYTNFESTMEAIKEKMIDRLGGYLLVRKENGVRYLDYLAEPINTCTQTIEFGKNLLDFSKSWDLTEFVTVIIPQGERLEEHPIDPSTGEEIEALDAYVDVSSVNGGSIYVYDQQMVNAYGWIEKKVSWSDVSLPSNLLRKANEYLSDVQFDNMILELSAVDLSYMMGSTAEGLKLFDKIHCISEPHGMDRYFPLVKLEIPIDDPSDTTFTLGDNEIKSSLSASLRDDRIETKQQFDSLPSTTKIIDDVVSEAHTDAEEIMNAKTNGYVTIVTEEDQTGIHSEKIVISDNKNYLNATRKWEWGLNGLAYYRNGINIGLALTMDGAIVADRITTGTLNAARIKAGVLSDVRNNNYWNLETGEFRLTTNTQFVVSTPDYTGTYVPTTSNLPASSWTNDQKEENLGKIYEDVTTNKLYRWTKEGSTYRWVLLVNTFGEYLYNLENDLESQIDGKIETWYQTSDPSTNWDASEKSAHTGDLWYYSGTGDNRNKTYRWNGSSWEEQNVSDAVFDKIDGKCQVFRSQPTPPYHLGDIWFEGTNGDIKTCVNARSSGNYVSTDWEKRNKYTDDTAVTNLNNSLNSTEVFRRLTNGGTIQGIFTGYDAYGNLGYYVNASYISTGILSDPGENTVWNLSNGNMTAKKLHIDTTNMDIDCNSGVIKTLGTIDSTSTTTTRYYSEYTGGELKFMKERANTKTGITNEDVIDINYRGIYYNYNSEQRSGLRLYGGNSGSGVGSAFLDAYKKTYDRETGTYYYDSVAHIGVSDTGASMGSNDGSVYVYKNDGSVRLDSGDDYNGHWNVQVKTNGLFIDTTYSSYYGGDYSGEFQGYTGWFSNNHGYIRDSDGYYHDLKFVNGILVENNVWT